MQKQRHASIIESFKNKHTNQERPTSSRSSRCLHDRCKTPMEARNLPGHSSQNGSVSEGRRRSGERLRPRDSGEHNNEASIAQLRSHRWRESFHTIAKNMGHEFLVTAHQMSVAQAMHSTMRNKLARSRQNKQPEDSDICKTRSWIVEAIANLW